MPEFTDRKFKTTLIHLKNYHNYPLSWTTQTFDELMQIHENDHHYGTFKHCGVWNKKRDKPCENKAIVRLTFPNNSQLVLCNAHTLNVARVSQGHWSEINIERI